MRPGRCCQRSIAKIYSIEIEIKALLFGSAATVFNPKSVNTLGVSLYPRPSSNILELLINFLRYATSLPSLSITAGLEITSFIIFHKSQLVHMQPGQYLNFNNNTSPT